MLLLVLGQLAMRLALLLLLILQSHSDRQYPPQAGLEPMSAGGHLGSGGGRVSRAP